MKLRWTQVVLCTALALARPLTARQPAVLSESPVTAVNVQDSLALVALYNSTNGPSWTNNTNWLTGPVGTWHGIYLQGDRVKTINLPNNNLNGPLPSELENLTFVEILYLYTNNLSGAIPAELGSMSSLKNVNMSNNALTGSIPSELGNLSNLVKLLINNNQLSGNIPSALGNLTNLQEFYFYGNQLEGTIPAELGNMTSLRLFTLADNKLTGSIPAELGNLSNLESLALFNNQLSGQIPSNLGNLPALTYLSLKNNRLNDAIPDQLGNITTLEELYLNGNMLLGPVPSSLQSLTSLLYLDFRWNGLCTDDAGLLTFLNAKQVGGGDWESTQTVPPNDVSCSPAGDSSIVVTWTPIAYREGSGGYRVHLQTENGPFREYGTTADKESGSMEIHGLSAGPFYTVVVQSVTEPHADNDNTVVSDSSAAAGALITGDFRAAGEPVPGAEIFIEQEPDGKPVSMSLTKTDSSGAFLLGLGIKEPGTFSIIMKMQLSATGSRGGFAVGGFTTVKALPRTLAAADDDFSVTWHSPGTTKIVDDSLLEVGRIHAGAAAVPLDWSFHGFVSWFAGNSVIVSRDSAGTSLADSISWGDTLRVSVPENSAVTVNTVMDIKEGRSLAHELTHTVQQSAAGSGAALTFTPADSGLYAAAFTLSGGATVYQPFMVVLDVTLIDGGGTDVTGHDAGQPGSFALMQNYPNPFNPETSIRFRLPGSLPVRARVYDVHGALVATLADESMGAGTHTLRWNAAHCPSGVYLYRLDAGPHTAFRKCLLLK